MYLDYAQMTGDYDQFKRDYFEAYQGKTHEAFASIRDRRRAFHEAGISKISEHTAKHILDQNVQKKEPMSRGDLKNDHLRYAFDWALHEMRIKDWDPEGRYPASLSIDVYLLKPAILEKLDSLLFEIARHEAQLEVLAEVEHHLNGHDTFTDIPGTEKNSVAEIAREVMRRHPGKSRAERKQIALDEYTLSPAYRGKTDKRSIDKALDTAFDREEKKMSTKPQK